MGAVSHACRASGLVSKGRSITAKSYLSSLLQDGFSLCHPVFLPVQATLHLLHITRHLAIVQYEMK